EANTKKPTAALRFQSDHGQHRKGCQRKLADTRELEQAKETLGLQQNEGAKSDERTPHSSSRGSRRSLPIARPFSAREEVLRRRIRHERHYDSFSGRFEDPAKSKERR